MSVTVCRIAHQDIPIVFAITAHIVGATFQKLSQQDAGLQLRQAIKLGQHVAVHIPLAQTDRNDHVHTF